MRLQPVHASLYDPRGMRHGVLELQDVSIVYIKTPLYYQGGALSFGMDPSNIYPAIDNSTRNERYVFYHS